MDTKKVTRVELIDQKGRIYQNWNVADLEFSLQDDGRTLKIFVKGEKMSALEYHKLINHDKTRKTD